MTVVDPLINCEDVREIYGINSQNKIPKNIKFSVIICTVAHDEYIQLSKKDWEKIISQNGFFFDLKGFMPRDLDVIRP